MNPSYEPYTVADPLWYEPLERYDDNLSMFAAAKRQAPEGWVRQSPGIWITLRPDGGEPLPPQGWKVHLSATPETAEATIDQAWSVCHRLRVPWKFLRSKAIVTVTNGKYAARSASGKVVTAYPADERVLRRLVFELDTVLSGVPGPYILSDLRWAQGPVYLRYGAFVPMWCELSDETRAPAIQAPSGDLVPDVRRPAFTMPSWVRPPSFLPERPSDDGNALVGQYKVLRALHFSNAGGVYLAQSRDGQLVVLKEARPYAGLDPRGLDAVSRLRNEYQTLRSLQHLPWVPRLYEKFTAWEHEYLALEYEPGPTIGQWIAKNLPLARHQPGIRALRRHAARVSVVFDSVERCIDTLHGCGLAHGDLHHNNIVLRPNGDIALLDFELASAVDAPYHAALGAPGFSLASVAVAGDADRFALACCRLAGYVPLTALATQDRTVFNVLLEMARDRYRLAPGIVNHIATDLRLARDIDVAPSCRSPEPPAAADLVAGINSAASPHRSDRLFPADVGVDAPGASLGLAHGASGVLLALLAADQAVPSSYVDWLSNACRHAPTDTPTGLYDGLAGAALLLHRIGLADELAPVLDRVLSHPPRGTSLYAGITGVAHLLFELRYDREALRWAETVADRCTGTLPWNRPGLLRGSSGAAVLFARCAQVSGSSRWMDLARAALRADLRHGSRAGGRLRLSAGRTTTSLSDGSAGVALAALSLGPSDHPHSADVVHAAIRAAAGQVVVHGGLFTGRAGVIYLLASAVHRWPSWEAELAEQRGLLGLHAPAFGVGRVLIGERLLRLSTDLATGSAGALLALAAADHPHRALLPGAHAAPLSHDRLNIHKEKEVTK
jgi:serine/threonine protein kinase